MAKLSRVVLVGDDNSINRYIACRTLRHANFTTIEAGWGREVVDHARRFHPDIIILDMHMRDQSGIETLHQLRADPCTASIPVVFLTAAAESTFDRDQAEQLGASAYLFNPVKPDALVAVVEASIRQQCDPDLPRSGHRIVYEAIVGSALCLMGSDYASMQMLFPERGTGGELRLLAFRGFTPQAANFWEWVRADSKSTCGIALRDMRRVVATDIATCDFMTDSEDQEVYLQAGILACQTTPLIARSGNVVGMISTHWRTPHQASEDDFRLFDILARRAADAIEGCRQANS